MRAVLLRLAPLACVLVLAACGAEPAKDASAPPKVAGPLSSADDQPRELREAQTDLLLALQGVATDLGGASGFDRAPATACDEQPGRVTTGMAQRIPVADGKAALEAIATRAHPRSWRVRRTPQAVFVTWEGYSLSAVLAADGRTVRLSGGTPCLPGTPGA